MIKGTIKRNGIEVEVEANSPQELAELIMGALGTGSAKTKAEILPQSATRDTSDYRMGWRNDEVLGIAEIVKTFGDDPKFYRRKGGMTRKATKLLKKMGSTHRTYGATATLASAIKRYMIDGQVGYLAKHVKNLLDNNGYTPVKVTNYLSEEPIEA